jgi:hypothetical protein
MSTRGNSIAADTRLFTDEPHRRLWWVATGLLYLVLANLVAIAAFLGATPKAQAADAVAVRVPVFVTPGEVRSGALLLRSDNDRYVEAPLVGTDVDLVVSGPTARARVTQIFHNPTDGWVEAVYVIRCRRAARSTPSKWWSATASSWPTSRSGRLPARSTSGRNPLARRRA